MATLDAVTLGLSPYAYYRMNETSGTTLVDSSGNGLNGTYASGVTLNQTPLTTNDSGSPSLPGGTSGGTTGIAVTGVLSSNTNVVSANQSISFWFMPSGTITSGSFYNVFGMGNPNSATYKGLGITVKGGAAGTGYVQINLRNTAGTLVQVNSATIGVVVGTLYCGLIVIDSVNNSTALYLNTVKVTGTYEIPSNASGSPYNIGQFTQGTAANMPGTFGEFAFFASALTAANASALYTAGTTISAPPVSVGAAPTDWQLLRLLR